MTAMVFSGVVLVATGAAGDKVSASAYACFAGAGVDAARTRQVCADLQAVLRDSPATADLQVQDAPLAEGPGVEIEVTQISDTHLEVVPTLVDAAGLRAPQPSAGMSVMDTTMTSARRRAFLTRLLSALPK